MSAKSGSGPERRRGRGGRAATRRRHAPAVNVNEIKVLWRVDHRQQPFHLGCGSGDGEMSGHTWAGQRPAAGERAHHENVAAVEHEHEGDAHGRRKRYGFGQQRSDGRVAVVGCAWARGTVGNGEERGAEEGQSAWICHSGQSAWGCLSKACIATVPPVTDRALR